MGITASERDETIVRLNSLGVSLSTIANELGCHTTSVTSRLQRLGIAPADTRRAFMEDIYKDLSPAQAKWLSEQLGPTITIKDYVRDLITRAFLNNQSK